MPATARADWLREIAGWCVFEVIAGLRLLTVARDWLVQPVLHHTHDPEASKAGRLVALARTTQPFQCIDAVPVCPNTINLMRLLANGWSPVSNHLCVRSTLPPAASPVKMFVCGLPPWLLLLLLLARVPFYCMTLFTESGGYCLLLCSRPGTTNVCMRVCTPCSWLPKGTGRCGARSATVMGAYARQRMALARPRAVATLQRGLAAARLRAWCGWTRATRPAPSAPSCSLRSSSHLNCGFSSYASSSAVIGPFALLLNAL